MTVGELRNERRLELIAFLKESLVLLEAEDVFERPCDLDAVSAALYFAQPVADRLAQKPAPLLRPPLESYGLPVLASPYLPANTFVITNGRGVASFVGE